MKLQELSAPTPSKQIAKVFESYFGSRIRFDQLTRGQTQSMLGKVRGILGEHRKTAQRHSSEQDPRYLQLVMMEQALSSRLQENMIPPAPGTAPATPQAAVAGGQPAVAGAVAKDPKLAAALKKSSAGQTLNPEEQKLVAGAAMMQAESRFRRMARRLNESEIQQAQVVLAAQDMVDKMQAMLEDVSELQFKELPALVDSIKNQVGIDQAAQFNADATAALTGLLQNMTHEEIEAVLAHEVAHIANGDMVTMTLIQGVMNTFVVFLSRVVGYAVDSFLRKNDEENTGPGMGYWITTIVLDIVLGFAAAIVVAWFSRHREFRADAGAADLMGRKQPMMNALARLGGLHTADLPKSVAAMGIAGGIGQLFSTHPPIEERIAALQNS